VEPHKNLGFLATQETSTHDKKRGKSGKFSPKLKDIIKRSIPKNCAEANYLHKY
jgi:hypothetical protein